jgi:hypothetical protein
LEGTSSTLLVARVSLRRRCCAVGLRTRKIAHQPQPRALTPAGTHALSSCYACSLWRTPPTNMLSLAHSSNDTPRQQAEGSGAIDRRNLGLRVAVGRLCVRALPVRVRGCTSIRGLRILVAGSGRGCWRRRRRTSWRGSYHQATAIQSFGSRQAFTQFPSAPPVGAGLPAGFYAVSQPGWRGAEHTNTRHWAGAQRTIARLGRTTRENALVVRAEERPGVARPGFLASRQLIVADPELLLHLCHGPGTSTRESDARRRCREASHNGPGAREAGLCLSS